MNVLIFLVPLAVVLGAIYAGLFSWAVRQGQYDDLDDPARRMLEDDDPR